MSHVDPAPHIVCYGNPSDGFEHVGPFDCSEDAIEYADKHVADYGDYWIIMLQLPASDGKE